MPSDSLISQIRALAVPGTEAEALARLATELKRVKLVGASGLKPIRVHVLTGVTSDYLLDPLRLMLVRGGYAPGFIGGGYGGLTRGLMGEAKLTPDACDAAIVILNHRDLQFPPSAGMSADEAVECASREAAFWVERLTTAKVPSVVLSFDLPPRRLLAEQDGLMPGGLTWHVKTVNLKIAEAIPSHIALVDAEVLQATIGAQRWHDERLYFMCKQPYSMETLPEIAHALTAALLGLLGRARKVLVLDLDNTLWGGVVGDDGLQGLELGPETPEGEAFAAFQTYALGLSRRGIVLAVCSKNREEAALSPFREHTGMVLKESDIACFVANFQDKATNLRQIASTLNLGLDSLVFVDDNPVERALIRKELPEVMVVELPEDPAGYAEAVEAARAFPLRSLTREDLSRADSYKAIAQVRAASANETDMDTFLIGLSPIAHREAVSAGSLDRIVQLIKKTNQFKLNLDLFTAPQIEALAGTVVALRLSDRLQDYGIVAVAVARVDGKNLHVLNWVMSCRVFGRRLEHLTVQILDGLASASGCDGIVMNYTATEKNVILPDILRGLGFDAHSDGLYSRPTGTPLNQLHHMTLKEVA